MRTPWRMCPTLLLGLAALLAGLAFPGRAAPADKTPPAVKAAEEAAKKAAEEARKAEEAAKKLAEQRAKAIADARKKAAEEAKKRFIDEFKGKESEALKEAYILLAASNHDYGGHCGKAKDELEAAINAIDNGILKSGDVAQRIKTIQDRQAAGAAKAASNASATIHESQMASDVQLVNAGAIIEAVIPALAANKQPHALEHSKAALKEIEIALTMR